MSFDTSPNTTNVRLGTCSVRYKGVDLGYTMGGVEVEVTTNTHETKVDQFGDVVANEFIQGRNIMVRVPMAEVTLYNMVRIMPGASLVSTDGAQASGTLTVTSNPAAAETVTVNGQAITFVVSGADPYNNEVNIGATLAETAENIADLITQAADGDFANLSASASGAVVTITYNLFGTAGNSVGLVDGTAGDITVSGATLTGGADASDVHVAVATGIGISLLDIAGELLLHPIALPDSDRTEDLVIPLAATAGAMTFAYKYDEERVFNAEFKGYPAADGTLFLYGDKLAGP